jgi:hypothetical protein
MEAKTSFLQKIQEHGHHFVFIIIIIKMVINSYPQSPTVGPRS